MKCSSYQVISCPTNLEYIRKPKGFAFDLSVGIPAILLSESLELDSIHYGYNSHHIEQVDKLSTICMGDWELSTDGNSIYSYNFWNSLFKVSNLELSFPILGLSPILVHKIVESTKYSDFVVKAC